MITLQAFTESMDVYREIQKIEELEQMEHCLTGIEIQGIRLYAHITSKNVDVKHFDKMIRELLGWYKEELLREMERLGVECKEEPYMEGSND